MSAKNNCTFTSRLGRDAQVRFTQSGKAVMGFAIPVESGFGESKVVSWCDCSLWGKKAESKLIDWMKKGQEVTVIGEISLNTYQANDGSEKTSLKMNVADIALVGGKPAQGQQQNAQQPYSPRQENGQGGFPNQGGNQQQAIQQDPFAGQQSQPVEDDIPF